MREIKFRAWAGWYNDDMKIVFSDDYYNLEGFFSEQQKFEALMQYTGLKDKNGKEIYEGDIITHIADEEVIGKVIFEEAGFKIAWYGVSGSMQEYGFDEDAGGFGFIESESLSDFVLSDLIVKGNIYENQEMINSV